MKQQTLAMAQEGFEQYRKPTVVEANFVNSAMVNLSTQPFLKGAVRVLKIQERLMLIQENAALKTRSRVAKPKKASSGHDE